MTPEERNRLLASYATGGLSEAERRRLTEASLADPELFEALYDEEPLRELLSDAAARGEVLAALEEPASRYAAATAADATPLRVPAPVPPRRWWLYAGVPAVCVLGAALVVSVVYLTPHQPVTEVAQVQRSAEPAAAPPPAMSVPAKRAEAPRAREERKTNKIAAARQAAAPSPPPAAESTADKKVADERAPAQAAQPIQVQTIPVQPKGEAAVRPSAAPAAESFRESDLATMRAAAPSAGLAVGGRAMSKVAGPAPLQGPGAVVDSGQPARVIITAPSDGPYRLVRLDARGNTVETIWSMDVKAGSTATVELGVLPAGAYRYRLEPTGTEVSFRVR